MSNHVRCLCLGLETQSGFPLEPFGLLHQPGLKGEQVIMDVPAVVTDNCFMLI